jgi:CxxC motif-containing protein (DUF1111 family)
MRREDADTQAAVPPEPVDPPDVPAPPAPAVGSLGSWLPLGAPIEPVHPKAASAAAKISHEKQRASSSECIITSRVRIRVDAPEDNQQDAFLRFARGGTRLARSGACRCARIDRGAIASTAPFTLSKIVAMEGGSTGLLAHGLPSRTRVEGCMLHVFRRHLGLAISSSLLALGAGCSLGDGAASTPASDGTGGNTVGAGSGGSSGTGTGTGGATTGSGGAGGNMPPGMPPPDGCSLALPGSFTTQCSACHTANGQANTRYPDLYKFQGMLADFVMRVRTGSPKGMAAYPESVISDADLGAIYAYFTGNTRQGQTPIDLGGVAPLFTSADAKNPPISWKRDDGALVTRGAGRVRGRHEKEGSFGTYGPHYFQDRSYGFIVEDFTSIGQKRIRVTYLPIAKPDHTANRITNWRAWKMPGNNATFMENKYLADVTSSPVAPTGPVAQVQQYDEQFTPQTRTMDVGQNFEFEFGVFLDPAALTTPGSRNSYYTDTFRYRIGLGGLTPNNLDYAEAPGPTDEAKIGGDTTIAWLFAEPDMYFSQMALNTQQENVQSFLEGRRLFHTDFTNGQHSETGNPVFTEQAGKAGPLMNATSCETCHVKNGPGALLDAPLDLKSSMVFKLYGAGDLGTQLQLQEGSASVSGTEERTVALDDGTMVALHQPKFIVTATSGDPSRFSARIARKLVGLGLLEAIDERTLLARADRLDCDRDGISGRPSYVKDPVTGVLRIGRMGWKAEKVGIAHQVADALSADIGVDTSILPGAGGKTELSDDDLARLTTYMRLIGVPPQRNHDQADVARGESLFKTVGCSGCHVTDVVTGENHPFVELRSQPIRPFTDLLLHDMGSDLADDSGVPASDAPDAPPAASEWRTPPLWGIGLYATVNGHTGLLHDGRAAGVLEAVLWHGGEAEAVKHRFMALGAADRQALLAFVQSL